MAARKGARRPLTLKLNLLPPHVKAAKKATMATIVTVIGSLVILAGMGLWWQRNAAAIGGLQKKLDELTPKAEEVQKMQQDARNIENGVKVLTDRLAVLDDVRKSGKQWTDMLQQVRMWIPEGVRLTAFIPQGTPTQANTVQLVGYTSSVRKLREFYSYLSQADVFSSVTLAALEWNGTIYPGTQLPAVLPKAPPLKGPEEAGAAPPSPGAPQAPPAGAPGAMGAPPMAGGATMGAPGGPPPEEEMMGAPGGAPPMAGGATMGGPGAAGGPMGAPPMGGAMRGMMPMMPGVGMGGMGGMGAGQVQIVRDPTAPRNVVYFVIVAQLSRPVQVAASLMVQPAAGVGGMPGGMMGGAMPGGMMGGAAGAPMMGGPMMGGPMMGGPMGMPGGPAAPPAAGGAAGGEEGAGEEAGTGLRGGLGRRGAAAGLE